jgi:hypothetical protein
MSLRRPDRSRAVFKECLRDDRRREQSLAEVALLLASNDAGSIMERQSRLIGHGGRFIESTPPWRLDRD